MIPSSNSLPLSRTTAGRGHKPFHCSGRTSSPGPGESPLNPRQSPHPIPRPKPPDEVVEPCALRLALPRWSASIFPDILAPLLPPIQPESSPSYPCPPDPCPSYHSPDQLRPSHIGFQPINATPPSAFLCPTPPPAGRTLSASKHVLRL
ncbi:hypothetical protein J3F83DRAFT_743480 [Trichoderma novae-zelandiae]